MEKKRTLRQLLISLVILAAAGALGVGTGVLKLQDLGQIVPVNGQMILKLVLLVCGVLVLKNLLVLLLGLAQPENHRVRSVLSLISSMVGYVAFLVILCFGLTILGVNMTTVVASVGVLALIVGFSAESLIADVVTGTFMLLENQYNVGDIVEVNGFRGTVTSIGIRTTCITDGGDNVKIINNSEMKNILNRSDHVSKAVCDIGIPYETDLEQLEQQIPALLEEIYGARPDTLAGVPEYLGVQALQDSAVLLRFVAPVTEKNIFAGMRVLNHDLLLGFRKLGVECPYPQVDVHSK